MTNSPGGDRGRQAAPVKERFWAKVKKNKGGCWEWQGSINNSGYGTMLVGSRRDGSRRTVGVHRFVFELAGVDIPEGFEPDHVCEVRHCVKIGKKHLRLVTVAENRGKFNRSKTHCPRGHKLPEPDVNGRRRCQPCNRIDSQRWYQKSQGDAYGRKVTRRKRKLSDKDVKKLRKALRKGDTLSEVAARFGVSEAAIRYWIRKES